jgi:hypothetical protein
MRATYQLARAQGAGKVISTAWLSWEAYGHNGYFKSLKENVHFYNTRDTLSGRSSRSTLMLTNH